MTDDEHGSRVVSASREVAAPAEQVFELIADPARQPQWDGNDNLGSSAEGHRVRAVGDSFVTELKSGKLRENHVVEFEEGRLIAWRPSEVGSQPFGHLWRWELKPTPDGTTRVTHTYDWTQLTDRSRFERARSTTAERLSASLDRLAALVEGQHGA
ncbi:SRPBCC family protein [Ornithinimicrobium avium]|uniref:Polyketide cyclase n=1 Tax=Ornithinimicrobium avium TaxID=2283195 RepID=A0A345NIN3_9MICO|nr:SRPBCC family protein [Ornithinimicrobium avium]AXH94891.1 polyketide cyclase [Ornithinimicrobium avium]